MFDDYKNIYVYYQKAFFVWRERLFESAIKAIWEHQKAFSEAAFCARSKENSTRCFWKRAEHRIFRRKTWYRVRTITKQGGDKNIGWKAFNPPIESVFPINITLRHNESQLLHKMINSTLLNFFVNIFYFTVSRNARWFSCHNRIKSYRILCRRTLYYDLCFGIVVIRTYVFRFLSPPRDNTYGQNTTCN